MADPYEKPALATPPGVISHFPTTHSDEQAWYYVSATLSTVVSGILLLLRLYTKLRVIRKLDLTDYLPTLAFLFLIALVICGRLCLGEEAGVHQWNLPLHNYIGVNYWFYVAQIVYAPTICLVKTAILLQYLRLFAPQKTVDPFMWYSARIVITTINIWYTISTFLTIFACSPREALWNPLITDSRCLNNNTSAIISLLFNVVSDITILMLPVRAVWRLRMPMRNKIKIMMLFAIGLLACIATAMTIVYLDRMGGHDADVSYNTAWAGIWAFAEISLGITVTGTVMLPKFIEAKGPKLRGIFSGLTRPLTSPTSGGSLGSFIHAKRGTAAAQEVALDTVTMIGRSESDVGSIDRDQGVKRQGSSEDVYTTVTYSSVNVTNDRHKSMNP